MLRGGDPRGQLDAKRSQPGRANRYEQRLGRFTPAIQVLDALLDQVGTGKDFRVEAGHSAESSCLTPYRWGMASDAPELDEFEAMVADAIDRLPDDFQKVLETVPVVVSELGAEERAYGQYFGDGIARQRYEDRIVIYRDTLERDFGHDRELLAAQVERTLRHELAHHLGWGERGVGELGL